MPCAAARRSVGQSVKQRSARQQARGVECRKRRIDVADDQRNFSTCKRRGIAAFLLLEPGDDLLEISDALRTKSTMNQLGHDDLAEAFPFGRLGENALDPAGAQLRRVD